MIQVNDIKILAAPLCILE